MFVSPFKNLKQVTRSFFNRLTFKASKLRAIVSIFLCFNYQLAAKLQAKCKRYVYVLKISDHGLPNGLSK